MKSYLLVTGGVTASLCFPYVMPLPSCFPFTESMGLKTTYTKDTDQRLADYDKRKARAAKVKLQDDKDARTGANEGLVKKSDGTYFSAIEIKKFSERQAKKKKNS